MEFCYMDMSEVNSNMKQAIDTYGRRIKYLRISVTDRCNFRCRYCVPQHEFESIPPESVLRYEDINFIVNTFAKLGVERIRITGGEPLVRKDLPTFISGITKIDGIKEVTVTTNGVLLKQQAQALYDAGVRRLNISFDSLNPERYKYITGGYTFDRTVEGIKLAKEIGFAPIKLNSVVIKGFNDDEIIDLCDFAMGNGFIIRFIEFMPIGNSPDWNKDSILSGQEILQKIQMKYTTEALPQSGELGPARNFNLYKDNTLLGQVGIINPISHNFCDGCDKLRLTSDGCLRPCLLTDTEISLVEATKAKDETQLIELLMKALNLKHKEHDIDPDSKEQFSRTMHKIGG